MKISEGTISYLIGCHQFLIHPLCVLAAWIKEYRQWPAPWELVCIFIHDIGHIGLDYLSDSRQKTYHWVLGAEIALRLFGAKGFLLVAGHSAQSGYPRSKLYIPDKKSWLVAPDWWLDSNRLFEDFQSDHSGAKEWKKLVAKSMREDFPNGLHRVYLDHKNDR